MSAVVDFSTHHIFPRPYNYPPCSLHLSTATIVKMSIKPPSPKLLEHLMSMLKCMEKDAEIDYDKMVTTLNLKRRSAQTSWCRLKKKYELRAGDRSRMPSPTGRDLQVILVVITCFVEVPKVNYSAMMQVANLSRRSAQSIVCRLKKDYFK